MVHTMQPIIVSYVLCKLEDRHDTIPIQSRRIIVSASRYPFYQPLGFKAFSRRCGPATSESTSCSQRVLRLPHSPPSSPRLILASLKPKALNDEMTSPCCIYARWGCFIGLAGNVTSNDTPLLSTDCPATTQLCSATRQSA
jgi:hypothetical protein